MISVNPNFFLFVFFFFPHSSVSRGDEYLASQGISASDLWYNEIALASMTVILMTFAYIALRLIKKEK